MVSASPQRSFGVRQVAAKIFEPLRAAFQARRRGGDDLLLPGGRCVAVDAKVPLNAYLEAVNATDEATRRAIAAPGAATLPEDLTGSDSAQIPSHSPHGYRV